MEESRGTTSHVPLEEVQGNISPGFRKDFQAFLFLRFPNGANDVQVWLQDLLPCIASARQVATFNREYRKIKSSFGGDGVQVSRFWRSTWVNVAFTAEGLRRLMPDDAPQANGISGAFADGMCRRLEDLYETPDILQDWQVRDGIHRDEPGDPADLEPRIAHVLLLVGSDTAHDLGVEVSNQLALATRHGLSLISLMNGQTLGGGRDHFGFRDGISQPDPDDPLCGWTWRDPEFEDAGLNVPGSEQKAPPGLFIRGCETYRDDPLQYTSPKDWEKFGSYLVFRRFRQDVEGFKERVREVADDLRRQGVLPMNERLLMARLIGRWPSGAKLEAPAGPNDEDAARDPCRPDQSAGPPRSTLTRDDYFEDRNGLACPMSAHVRVAYPRSVLDAKKHRIIRRGITYTEQNGERGLLFVAYQASIEQGFQFIQAKWLNRSTSPEVQELAPRPAPAPEPAPEPEPAKASTSLGMPAMAARPEVEPDPAPVAADFLRRSAKGLDILTALSGRPRLEVAAPARRPARSKFAGSLSSAGSAEPAPEPAVVGTSFSRLNTIEGGGYFFSPSLSNVARLAGIVGRLHPDPDAPSIPD